MDRLQASQNGLTNAKPKEKRETNAPKLSQHSIMYA